MKKIILLIFCLCIFTGCENAKMNATGNNTGTDGSGNNSTEYDSEYYEIIGLDKFKEVYASDTPTLIYFGASWCGNCTNFMTVAKQFAKKHQISVYFVQLDAADFTSEDNAELDTLVETDGYIPYIAVFKNKEKLYGQSGYQNLEAIETLAEEYGILSKDE